MKRLGFRFLFLVVMSAVTYTAAFADTFYRNPFADVLHYRFTLRLSDQTDSIYGQANVRVQFRKDDVGQLRMDLAAAGIAPGKGMTVSSIKNDGKSLSFTHQGETLLITLPSVRQGQVLELTIEYAGIPDAGLAIKKNRYNDRSFFSDNWPNLGHHWLPLVDHPSDKATCEFIVTAPDHYEVVSNGLLQEETSLGKGMKRTHWKQAIPIAPWLFVLGVADFAVQYVDTFDGKSIQTWVYRQDRDAGFHDFQTPSKAVLTFFSDYIGPFVYEKLANIQSNTTSGGMEAASAIMYSEKSVSGQRDARWQTVIVHEIAHQWFGDAVTESDWDDVWLSEGFATYFTLLFDEHDKGRDVFVQGLKSSRETVKKTQQANWSASIVHHQLSDLSKVTSAITYQKGAWFLHMLRNAVGDDAFKAGIRSYYRRFSNGNATTDDFRREMELASGLSLQSFFNQWLTQGGIPKLKARWSWDAAKKQVQITVEQTQPDYQFSFPIEFAVTVGESKTISKFEMTGKAATFSIPVTGSPTSMEIDPRTVLLADFDFAKK